MGVLREPPVFRCNMMKDYQAENDLHMLMEAEMIKKDSSRLGAAKRHVETQKEHLDMMSKHLFPVSEKPFNNSVKHSKMGK